MNTPQLTTHPHHAEYDATIQPMPEQHRSFLGLRLSALFEIALFLIVMVLLDTLAFDNNRFYDVYPHPFWAIIILVAAQYGTAEAVIAAIATSVVLLVGNLPEQTIYQDMYDYLLDIFSRPLMWLSAAVLVGELRQRHINERNMLRKELNEAEIREEKITASYQWVKQLKERLELRIASQLRSSVATYQAVKHLERLSPTDVLGGIEQMIKSVLNPQEFSIYLLENEELRISAMVGWQDNAPYKTVLTSKDRIYQEIIGDRSTLCVANEDDAVTLQEQGVLAGPIIHRETGELFGMIKIESLDFTDLNLSNVESFSAICEWAGMSFANSRKYMFAKQESIVNPDHNLFTASYFDRYTSYISSLAKRVGFNVTMVIVRIANAPDLDENVRIKSGRVLSQAVHNVLRQVDLAFDYQGTNDEYSIVLPATDRQGGDIVLEKIRRGLQELRNASMQEVRFSFSVQTLYEHA